MLEQTCLPDEKTALPLQVETDQAASPQDVASRRSNRFLWIGLGLVGLMLIGVSECTLYPHPSQVSAETSRLVREVAFSPIGIRAARLTGSSHASPTAFRPAVLSGARPAASFPVVISMANLQSRASTQMFAQDQAVEQDTARDSSPHDTSYRFRGTTLEQNVEALIESEAEEALSGMQADQMHDVIDAQDVTQAVADDKDVMAVRARLRMLGPYPVLSMRFPDMTMPEQFREEQKLVGETGVALDFVVDTAANVNTINAQLAKDLNLETVGFEQTGVSATGMLAGGLKYKLGDAQLNDLPKEERFTLMTGLVASALPVASPSGAGILGINFIFSFAGGAEFNWGDPARLAAEAAAAAKAKGSRPHEVQISDPTLIPSLTLFGDLNGTSGLIADLQEVPVQQLSNGLLAVTMKVNGAEIPALLDTGSPITVINAAAAKAAGIDLPVEPDQSGMSVFEKAAAWIKQGVDLSNGARQGEVVSLGAGVTLRKIPLKAPIALGGADIGSGRPYVGEIPGLAALDGLGAEAGPAAILGTDVLRQRKRLLIRDGKVFV